MKKFLAGAAVILAIALVVYLHHIGVIRWQFLTVLFAAFAAPFKWIVGLFTGSEAKIRERHAEVREQEATFQAELERRVLEREQRIAELNREIQMLNERLVTIENERRVVYEAVSKLPVEEQQKLGEELFGS